MTTATPEPQAEARLSQLGLSTDIIHSAFRPGLQRASNRTRQALKSSAGTDIYHDTMEQLANLLKPKGWLATEVNRQPRIVNPEQTISMTVCAARGVGNPDPRRQPRTGKKGVATRGALPLRVEIQSPLFDLPELDYHTELRDIASSLPLWFLLHERWEGELYLEFSRPAEMSDGGSVTVFSERIILDPLRLNDDTTPFFDAPTEEFHVPVERR